MNDQSKDNLLEEIREFVEKILEEAGLKVHPSVSLNGSVVNVELEGEDSGLVLRENARLMYAVNHLVNQVFYHKTGGEYSFVVDCDQYRGTRVMELQLLARKAAEKVRVSSQPFRLQPMPASERRVIHLALAEEEGISTESEGGGGARRVVILPSSA